MPGWLSQLLTQGAALAVVVALFVLSAVEPHLKDLVWGRLAGSVVGAATRRSREEQQRATAAAEKAERVRTAMAKIRTNLLTWATAHSWTWGQAAAASAAIHTGVAELRTEEPRAAQELDAILGAIPALDAHPTPQMAQPMLAALEAKLRDLDEEASSTK